MKEKVNLTTQIIFTIIGLFIPLVWLYPFYKIKKITRMIGIRFLIVGVSIIPMLILVGLTYLYPDNQMLIDSSPIGYMPFMIVLTGVGLVDIPFIIKWSRNWNKEIK